MILNHKFILITFIVLLAASFAGCSGGGGEDIVVPTEENKEVLLRLVVNIAKQPVSRADAPDDFEGPEGDFEDIQTLRVIIIKDANSNGDGVVEANKLVKTYASGQPANDILEFKVSTGSKRVYLIANEATLPVPPYQPAEINKSTVFLDNYFVGSDFNSTVLHNWSVSLPGSQPAATQSLYSDVQGATGLPLTEFFDFTVGADIETQQYDETQTVHLFMTRAAAKASFDVVIDKDYKGSGVNITGIRLNGLNWQQWVFPRETQYNPPKQVVITPGLPSEHPVPSEPERYITDFKVIERVNGVTGANITMNFSEQEQIAIYAGNKKEKIGPVYFPESIIPATLVANPAAAFSVQVQLDGNDEWLTAKQLGIDEGNNIQLIEGCQAISRNTHLKITIRFGEKGITAAVTVVPYIGVTLEPIFGTL